MASSTYGNRFGVLTWHNTDGDFNATLWSSEEEALIQGCSEIQDSILEDWDLTEERIHDAAKAILDAIINGAYAQAIDKWNDYQCSECEDYGSYYRVEVKDLLSGACVKKATLMPFGYTGDPDDDDGKLLSPDDHIVYPTINGSTCRGPCKEYNEYANSDMADGTHLCTQCKTFSSIFKP